MSEQSEGASGASAISDPPLKVFIVGLPRSGTSTLVHALRCIGFRGYAEGHFLGHLPALEELLTRYYDTWKDDNVDGTMLNGIKVEDLILHYRNAFRQVFEQQIGPPPWVDKNAVPYMMPYLRVIQSVWPEASFIFTRRYLIDFIFSAIRKFSDRSFEHFCEAIAFTFDNWEKQKAILKHKIEIDQSEFEDAETLADKLINFLRLDHKNRAVLIQNLQVQVERTASSYARHELVDLNLAPEQIEYFNQRCGPIMARYYKPEVGPGGEPQTIVRASALIA